MTRRGFSLAELMVALVIAGVIGVALTRLVISQARFVASQDGTMRARAVARAGLSVLSDELRQVPFQAVIAADKDSVVVRVPYAYGVVCGQSGGTTIASILPPDSARYAAAVNAGYSWRDNAGVWHRVEPATRGSAGTGTCTSAVPPVSVVPTIGGTSYVAAVAPNDVTTPVGAALYVYQKITYSFAASTEMPGRLGLWRNVNGGLREELAAPFDTSSHFWFLVGPMLRPQSALPPSLDSIGGVRVLLVAASENPPPGKTVPAKFSLISDIVFRNHDQ
jgi:prepilin-type N-terminal cleavage/methylation domain-containing protein